MPPTTFVVLGPVAGTAAAWAALLSVGPGEAVTAVALAEDGSHAPVPASTRAVVVDVDAAGGGRSTGAVCAAAALVAAGHKVVVLTAGLDRAMLSPLVDAGVAGIVSKHAEADEVRKLVRSAADGNAVYDSATAAAVLEMWRGRETPEGPDLTPRERDVLVELVASGGASNRVIGDALGVSSNTVKGHVSQLLGKLGVTSRAGAVAEAARLGIITP